MTPAAVYRAFDQAGALLYVGMAKNWARRWAQHSERSGFFREVARLEVEWFEDRADAAAAEIRLIQELNPRYNTVDAPRRPRLLLKCDVCGCNYAFLPEYEDTDWCFRPDEPCGDWRCRCGEPNCYTNHACRGIKRVVP